MDRSVQLGQETIPRLLLRFSLPATVGMMAMAMYVFIDRIFVGQALGPNAIAGAALALPFMLIVLAFGMLFGLGGAALTSIRLGQQRKPEAEQVLGNATVLLVVGGVLITLVGLRWLDRILVLFGASQVVLPYARDYLRIIVMGTVLQMLSFGLNAMIRGEGNPRIAMLTMLISVVLNAILAPIFIFKLHWGMQGAALATVMAQAFSATWVLLYFLAGPSLLRLRAVNLWLDWRLCGRIMVTGSPLFSMQIANSVVQSILLNQAGKYGHDMAISVMGIVNVVLMLVAMPTFGINQGTQPIVGYNFGARRFDRVRQTLLTAIVAASGLTLLGFVVAMLFPAQLIWLFNRKDVDLREMGTHALRLSMLLLPLIGFQVVSAGYFQAVGKPREAMLLMLSRQALLLIPAVLILPHFFGLNGVWLALPAADFGASALTGICLLPELRRLGQTGASSSS